MRSDPTSYSGKIVISGIYDENDYVLSDRMYAIITKPKVVVHLIANYATLPSAQKYTR